MAFIGVNNNAVTVGVTNVTVSEAKLSGYSERVRLVLTNVSTGGQVISIAVNGEAVVNTGLRLSPGGHASWIKDNSGVPVQQLRVNAVSDVAGGSLAVYEEVLNKGSD